MTTITTPGTDHQLWGFAETKRRGAAWLPGQLDDGQTNVYPNAIPVDDVLGRLFNFQAIAAPVGALVPTTDIETMTGMNEDGSLYRMVIDPTRKAIVRSDTGAVLGVFRPSYGIHQYGEWLVDNVANLLDSGLSIGAAGLLKGGAQAYVQVEVPETFKVAGVEFIPHLTAFTSHDGTWSSNYLRMTTLIVCKNFLTTLRFGGLKRTEHKISVKHTSRSHMALDSSRVALDLVMEQANEDMEGINVMTNITVSDAQFWSMIDAAFGKAPGEDATARAKTLDSNRREALLDLWHNDPMVTPWRGTAFGALQAFNTWAHHRQGVRGDRDERNVRNSLDGTTEKFDSHVMAAMERVLIAA
jgi:phage/plasmid-like protein (TIGR03299 family)